MPMHVWWPTAQVTDLKSLSRQIGHGYAMSILRTNKQQANWTCPCVWDGVCLLLWLLLTLAPKNIV